MGRGGWGREGTVSLFFFPLPPSAVWCVPFFGTVGLFNDTHEPYPGAQHASRNAAMVSTELPYQFNEK